MFKKFKVVYAYSQANLLFGLRYAPFLTGKTQQEVEELMSDIEMLNRALSKPQKSERWVVKFEVSTLWFFKKTHKLYLRSRSETSAIAKAKKFALGE